MNLRIHTRSNYLDTKKNIRGTENKRVVSGATIICKYKKYQFDILGQVLWRSNLKSPQSCTKSVGMPF